jgi:hypothetical protein
MEAEGSGSSPAFSAMSGMWIDEALPGLVGRAFDRQAVDENLYVHGSS